jgi:transposase
MPFRLGDREAGWQLPASLDALIPDDHPVRFVAAYLDDLDTTDWASMGISLVANDRGASRYHPRVLLAIWVWGFLVGVRASRKLEAACAEQLSFLWLTGQQRPDHNTLWRFYAAHRAGMRYLLTHTIQTAVRTGLVDLALQAVDGTKMAGNAAKDRTYDAKGLDRLIERTEQAIADLEAQNATGGDDAPPRLPDELATKTALLERVREAKRALAPGSRINLTDREARLLKSRSGYVAGYNAQAVVSPTNEEIAGCRGMVITAADVPDAPSDHEQLVPMMEQAAAQTGQPAETTLADGGYHSGAVLAATSGHCIVMPESQGRLDSPYHRDRFTYDAQHDTYTCPEGQVLTMRSTKKNGERVYRGVAAICRACPAFGRCTKEKRQGRSLEVGPYEDLLVAHRLWMRSEQAQRLYGRRKELVEPVFGIVKEQQGGRRFLLRGREAVRSEWMLLAAAFNLRTLARIGRHQRGMAALAS